VKTHRNRSHAKKKDGFGARATLTTTKSAGAGCRRNVHEKMSAGGEVVPCLRRLRNSGVKGSPMSFMSLKSHQTKVK